MNVGDYIDGPYQGVSQAPPQVRLAQQAEALEDCYVGIPQGAIKRPPITFLGQLPGHPGHTDGLAELFLGNDGNYYMLTATLESGVVVPRIYNVANPTAVVPITIAASAQTYLNAGVTKPVADLVSVTVEDNTFLLNRKQTIGTTGVSPTRPYEALIFVKLASYSKTYGVTVTPVGGTPVYSALHTPNGKDSTDGSFVATDVIAQTLESASAYSTVNEGSSNGIALSTLTSQGFTVSVLGPVIYLSHPTVDFTLVTSDDQAGLAMIGIKGSVQSFSDLPAKAVPNFTVKIAQQTANANDDFYVKYVPTAGSDTGVWQECIAPGVSLGFNPLDLPVSLTHPSDWEINSPAWKQRDVGNPTLLPDPDFVGRNLADLSFWQGRLVLVSSEAVMLSASDDPFRLYPRTVTTQLDDDPFELISPVPGKSTFKYCINFDQRLVVFGDKSQAAVQCLSGAPTLTTTSMANVSDFEYAGLVRPIPSNGNTYFVAPRGNNYSTVYELKSSRNSNGDYILLGEDLTAAVPRYVPATLDRAASCPVNFLCVYGTSGDTALYPHLFRYAEGQRVQNAWERWNFEGYTLGGIACHNTSLYVILCNGSAAYLCLIDLSPDVLDPGSTRLLTHLDFRVTEAQVTLAYNAALDQTTVTLPYVVPDGRTVVASVRAPGGVGGTASLIAQGGTVPEGLQAEVLSQEGNVIVLNGKWNALPMWFGLSYTALYTLSTIYALDRKGSPFRSNRMTLKRLKVDLAETGYLRAEVTPAGREVNSVEYTGYVVDDPGSALDQAPFAESATLSVPVFVNTERVTINLINDSIFQSKILGFEWLGSLTQKTTRLNG